MIDPDPLVPAEVDLRGLPWMAIDTVRLLDSDLFAISTGDEFKAAIRLWCKAWHQVPAASLPDDDRILAELSGKGRLWPKFKTMALRGFVKCSDGRLYHPVIAAKAIEAWEFRVRQRNKASKRWHPAADTEAEPGADAAAHAGHMPIDKDRTKTGTGTRTTTSTPVKRSAAPRRAPNPETKTGPAWLAYIAAYVERYGAEPTRNAVENAAMAAFCALVPLDEAPDIAAFYVRHSKAWYVSHQHSAKYLRQDAAGLRTQWLAGRQTTESSARQTDRSAARGQVFLDLIAEAKETHDAP